MREQAHTPIRAENLLVIVCINSQSVSSTVAVMHADHGDKVVAHKVIECPWVDLTWAARRQVVMETIHMATDSAGVDPYSVFMSMSDSSIVSRLALGSANLGEELMLTDLERAWALKRAEEQPATGDELLEAIPVHWTVGTGQGRREVADPIGERGSWLTCRALQITARVGYRVELERLIKGHGIEIEGVIAQPVALYRGIASSLPRKGSTLIIDCGARFTTLIVRRGEILTHLQTHAFGGDDLTRTLADQLQITWVQAEGLKRELDISVQADPGVTHEGQQFIWREMRERHRLVTPATMIVGEMIDRFFQARAQELRDAGLLGQRGQVNLFGRASMLGGLASRIKDAVGLPVHLGTGNRGRDPGVEMSDAVILGLVRSAADRRRLHQAENPHHLLKTASGIWSWLLAPIR